MKKQLFLVLLLMLACITANAQKKFSVYGVGFYNLENLWEDAPAEDIPDLD